MYLVYPVRPEPVLARAWELGERRRGERERWAGVQGGQRTAPAGRYPRFVSDGEQSGMGTIVTDRVSGEC